MITLKAALIAASAVGTVAVGGGATWAMTGTHHEAGLQSSAAKAPAAARQAPAAAPTTLPTCLPAKSDLPKAALPKGADLPDVKVPDAAAKKQVEQRLKDNPATMNLPGAPEAKLPKAEVPGVKAPDAELPDAKVPDAQVPDLKGKLPANLPTCAPSAKDVPGNARAAQPSARVPAKPGLPAVPKLDCGKLRPAVTVGGAVEKAVMLPKGLRYVSSVPGAAELRKQQICAVTQKWTGKAGQWLTVETLKTPAGMTQNQLRQALKLPAGGTPVTVAGVAGWQTPNGGGVLLFDPSGYSLFVNGSPVLAGGLQDVTAALHKAQ
ncbi:hypothetical protein [Actinomadura bangladeshensis]|uniref:Uncharacterized protein n=1 Tax=Actinomadura bangladeshensis TaxID=453573 RepID=A0A4R4NHP2_9ACTN|nr:hypothetical protein [Actinomadura bangladeshensis]TDC07120.1 hypothetical protein E1284_32860 [Actinomadura bangladeshensis]